MKTQRHGARLPIAAGLTVILAIGALVAGPVAYAAGPSKIGLGTAAPFAVLANTAVTNSGPTTITGELGISPGSAAAITGFPPGTVSGAIHTSDPVAVQAKSDLVSAYTVAAGLPVTATHGTLGGMTLVGGVYNAGGVVLNLTGTLTLDAQNNPTSVWVFQATSSLVTASSSRVALINGANPCNVFWQVTSSATLGSGSTFAGTIMALTSITMGSGVDMTGRALARNADVTLIDDTIANTCSAAAVPTATPTPSAAVTVAGVSATPAPVTLPPTNTATGGSSNGPAAPLGLMAILSLSGFMIVAAVTRRARARR